MEKAPEQLTPKLLSKNPAFGDQLVFSLPFTHVIALPGMVAEANANLRAALRGTGLADRAPNADGAAGTRGPGSGTPPGVLRAMGGGSGRCDHFVFVSNEK